MFSDSRIDVHFEDNTKWDTQCLARLSVGTMAATVCEPTADTRWIQSSHQKGLPPSQRDVKRITTAITGITPVTYAVTLMRFVNESCGLLQRVACAWSMSAEPSVALWTDAVIDIPNVWSRVHFSIRHGCKIAVEFLELHWHSTSRRLQPMRGKPFAIHSSYPGQLNTYTSSRGILLRMVGFGSMHPSQSLVLHSRWSWKYLRIAQLRLRGAKTWQNIERWLVSLKQVAKVVS